MIVIFIHYNFIFRRTFLEEGGKISPLQRSRGLRNFTCAPLIGSLAIISGFFNNGVFDTSISFPGVYYSFQFDRFVGLIILYLLGLVLLVLLNMNVYLQKRIVKQAAGTIFSKELNDLHDQLDEIKRKLDINIVKNISTLLHECKKQKWEGLKWATTAQKKQMQEELSRVEKLNDLLEIKSKEVVINLKQFDIEVKQFNDKPILKDGERLRPLFDISITLCTDNDFSSLGKSITRSRDEFNRKYQALIEMQQQIEAMTQCVKNAQFGKILSNSSAFRKKANEIRSSEFEDRVFSLENQAMEGIWSTYNKMANIFQTSHDFIEKNDFQASLSNLKKAESSCTNLGFSKPIPERFSIDFPRVQQEIDSCEKFFKVYTTMQEMAGYIRVTEQEVIERSRIESKIAEPIIKQIISAKLIVARFDDATKGIQFGTAELEDLEAAFQDWGDKKGTATTEKEGKITGWTCPWCAKLLQDDKEYAEHLAHEIEKRKGEEGWNACPHCSKSIDESGFIDHVKNCTGKVSTARASTKNRAATVDYPWHHVPILIEQEKKCEMVAALPADAILTQFSISKERALAEKEQSIKHKKDKQEISVDTEPAAKLVAKPQPKPAAKPASKPAPEPAASSTNSVHYTVGNTTKPATTPAAKPAPKPLSTVTIDQKKKPGNLLDDIKSEFKKLHDNAPESQESNKASRSVGISAGKPAANPGSTMIAKPDRKPDVKPPSKPAPKPAPKPGPKRADYIM